VAGVASACTGTAGTSRGAPTTSGRPPGSGLATGTTAGTTSSRDLSATQRLGADAVRTLLPAGSIPDHEIDGDCIGNRLQRDDLVEASTQPLAASEPGVRLRLVRVLATCQGPDVLVDLVAAQGLGALDESQRDCVKDLLLTDPLDKAAAVAAGDPAASEKFTKQLAVHCRIGTGTTVAP
jgi:hypothetical protein